MANRRRGCGRRSQGLLGRAGRAEPRIAASSCCGPRDSAVSGNLLASTGFAPRSTSIGSRGLLILNPPVGPTPHKRYVQQRLLLSLAVWPSADGPDGGGWRLRSPNIPAQEPAPVDSILPRRPSARVLARPGE